VFLPAPIWKTQVEMLLRCYLQHQPKKWFNLYRNLDLPHKPVWHRVVRKYNHELIVRARQPAARRRLQPPSINQLAAMIGTLGCSATCRPACRLSRSLAWKHVLSFMVSIPHAMSVYNRKTRDQQKIYPRPSSIRVLIYRQHFVVASVLMFAPPRSDPSPTNRSVDRHLEAEKR
jgi:hypothetical protein